MYHYISWVVEEGGPVGAGASNHVEKKQNCWNSILETCSCLRFVFAFAQPQPVLLYILLVNLPSEAIKQRVEHV